MNRSEIAKALNKVVTGGKFVDEDTNDYIYASLSQPPLLITNKNNSTNEFDYTVKCPTCGCEVNYGHEIFMLSGHHYCINDGCRDRLLNILGKEVK